MENEGSNGTSPYTSKNLGLYFRDGKRRIDYVLVYRPSSSKPDDHFRRINFLKELAKQQIEIEIEDWNGNLLGFTKAKKPKTTDHTKHNQIVSMETLSVSYASAPQPETAPDNVAETDWKSSKPSDTSPPTSMDRYRQQAMKEDRFLTETDNLVFVKLYASWKAMTYFAEYFKMRKPLRHLQGDSLDTPKQSQCCDCLQFGSDLFKPIKYTYSWPFTTVREYLFDIPPDRDEFFTTVERSLVLDYVLRRTGFKNTNEDLIEEKYETEISLSPSEVENGESIHRQNEGIEKRVRNMGITKLISDGVFLAAYPLHEPTTKMLNILNNLDSSSATNSTAQPDEQMYDKEILNNRILLERYWASYSVMGKCQPLDYVRYYFGDAVAFYFSWLGYYTAWLLPIALLGIVVFLFGLLDMTTDSVIYEICVGGRNVTMCPLCKAAKCKFWTLNSSCLRAKLMRLVDHEGTILFAVVMALWAVIFLELWKRKQAILAFEWNVFTLEPMDQPPRPEFMALLEKKNYPRKFNPVSGLIEPFNPFWRRKVPIFAISYSTVLLGVILTLAFLVGVLLYKLVIKAILYRNENAIVQSTAGMISTVTGSVINLIIIFIMKLIYDRLAIKLTDLEHPRTQVEYDNSLTLKLYLLQFVNYYSSIFYIAFIQGTTSALPGDDHLPIQSTGCDQGDCLFELFLQLVIIMVGKQLLGFIQESIMPSLMKLFFRLRALKRQKKFQESTITSNDANTQQSLLGQRIQACKRTLLCRSDYYLLDPGSRPLFNEYLEMMIQYGFITMFVPAFPLAPLFGLLNNIFEIRQDARKFTRQYRRPVLERVKTIGIWFSILSVLASIAIRTNACIIAFTTQFIDRWVYQYFYSPNRSMEGYINFTLSYMSSNRFPAKSNETYCRYDAYRSPPWSSEPYTLTAVYYHVLAAKFIFVFVFETLAIILTSIIAALIPDIPKHVKTAMYQENNITSTIILNAEMGSHNFNKPYFANVDLKLVQNLKASKQNDNIDKSIKRKPIDEDEDDNDDDDDDELEFCNLVNFSGQFQQSNTYQVGLVEEETNNYPVPIGFQHLHSDITFSHNNNEQNYNSII